MMKMEVTSALLLEKILTELENIRALLSVALTHPRGTTLTSTLHLKSGAPQTRIDFVDAQRHRNIPVTAEGRDNIVILGVPVTKILLANQGPGLINYDTNRTFGDLVVATPVQSDSEIEITSAEWPAIFSINLAAQDQDAVVRLTAVV